MCACVCTYACSCACSCAPFRYAVRGGKSLLKLPEQISADVFAQHILGFNDYEGEQKQEEVADDATDAL